MIPIWRLAIRALFVVVIAGPAQADDCATVLAAQTSQVKVPYAGRSTMVLPGQPPTQTEIVVTNGKMYVQRAGTWQVTDYAASEVLAKLEEHRKTAKLTCAKAGAEVIDGQAATLYSVHEEKPGNVSDSKLWLSDTSGLPLKIEMRFASVPFTNTIEYRYDNIVAPSDAK